MARYTEAVCRQCRREGAKLFLKGDRCYSDKYAFAVRSYAPGQHGQARKKVSEYGIQLREKQKARRIYGMLERQFHNTFVKAEKQKGITGENLLGSSGKKNGQCSLPSLAWPIAVAKLVNW